LWETIERGRRGRAPAALKRHLDERSDDLRREWEEFLELARTCRAERFEMAITHGDWIFNLLQRPGGPLHLVDWDEMLLAPPERDAWYELYWPGYLEGYRRVRPGYEPKPLGLAFYLYN